MRNVEIIVLVLVIIHAGQHLPREIRNGSLWVRGLIRRLVGDGPYPKTVRAAVAAAMILITAISVSPLVYYGLECGTRLLVRQSTAA